MTKEEAKQIIATWLVSSKGAKGQRGYIEGWFDEEDAEAFRMAIEALSADAVQGVGRYENAMQKLREMPRYLNNVKAKQIKKISADKPNGEWIKTKGDSRYMCSVCKVHQDYVPTCMGKPTIWDYCPSCGAKMKGGTNNGL